MPPGITLTDRQAHSERWVSHPGLHLLTDSLTVKGEYATRDYTYWQTALKGEYPTRDYTYWQIASKWRMSMLPRITLTDRLPRSEGWVSQQGLHLLTDIWRVSMPPEITLTDRHMKGQYPTRDYTCWQTYEGWVSPQGLDLLTGSLAMVAIRPPVISTHGTVDVETLTSGHLQCSATCQSKIISGGSIPGFLKRGRQHIIWPFPPENCMKIKNFWSRGGTRL